MNQLTNSQKNMSQINWLKKSRVLPTPELMKRAAAKLRGHFVYYGVTDNSRGSGRFDREIKKLFFKWLNRRAKKGWGRVLEEVRYASEQIPISEAADQGESIRYKVNILMRSSVR
jgi:hypothetical protein